MYLIHSWPISKTWLRQIEQWIENFYKITTCGQSSVQIQGFNKNWWYHIDGHIMSPCACIHKSTFVGHLLNNIQSMTPNFDDSPLIKHPPTSNTIIQHCIDDWFKFKHEYNNLKQFIIGIISNRFDAICWNWCATWNCSNLYACLM